MSFKKLALAGGAAATLMASTAYASVIDRPFFQVLGVVVVWGGTAPGQDEEAAPVVSDFVLLTNTSETAGADLIADNDVYAVVTGDLDAISDFDPITGLGSGSFADNGTAGVLDAADSFSAFGIDSTTDVSSGLVGAHNSSFYVASNAAFDIYAEATLDEDASTMEGMDLENIAYDMSIALSGTQGEVNFGGKSQTPGTVEDIGSLAELTGPTKVFDGTIRTATEIGTLAEQSVRFDNVYRLDSDAATDEVEGYDLSLGTGTLVADVTYTVYVP